MTTGSSRNVIDLPSRINSRMSGAGFRFGKSTKEDFGRIRAFYISHIAENNVLRKDSCLEETVATGRFIYVENEIGEICGTIARYLYPISGQSIVELGTLLLDPCLKGRGLTPCLIDLQMEASLEDDAMRPTLFVSGVFEFNKSVIDKYKRFGSVHPPYHQPVFIDYFLQTCDQSDYRTSLARHAINWFFFSPETLFVKADSFDIRSHISSQNILVKRDIEQLLIAREKRNQILLVGGVIPISHSA